MLIHQSSLLMIIINCDSASLWIENCWLCWYDCQAVKKRGYSRASWHFRHAASGCRRRFPGREGLAAAGQTACVLAWLYIKYDFENFFTIMIIYCFINIFVKIVIISLIWSSFTIQPIFQPTPTDGTTVQSGINSASPSSIQHPTHPNTLSIVSITITYVLTVPITHSSFPSL